MSPTSTPSPLQAVATMARIASPTAIPTQTPSATSSQSLRPVRIALPATWAEPGALLAEFFERHASLKFLVEVVPDSTQALAACQEGRADMAIYHGPRPGDLSVHSYRTEKVAAIVPFFMSLEEITSDALRSVFAGEEKARSRLGITEALCWGAGGLELLGLAEEKTRATIPAGDLVKRIERATTSVALVPYSVVSAGVRALRVDGFHPAEEGYGLVYHAAVLSRVEPRLQALAADLAGLLRADSPPAGQDVIMALVGDIMLARDMGEAIRHFGPAYPFAAVHSLLQEADLTLGNLECAISERGEPEPKAYTFRAPLTAAQSLRDAGFDLLNLANNHTLDYGILALRDTLDILAASGLKVVGVGLNEALAYTPVFLVVRGLRLAFLGYTHYPSESYTAFPAHAFVADGDNPGVAWAEPARIRAEVAAAKERADLVIVALHAGREYAEIPDERQREAAHAAIEAGASLVWGHHAHSWQGIEFYQGGVILYSLGDFVFDQMITNDTAIARVHLNRRGVRQVELWPVVIAENGRPVPADEAERRVILDKIYRLSDLWRG